MDRNHYRGRYDDNCDDEGASDDPKARPDFLGIVPGGKVDFHRAADGSVVITRADSKQPASGFDKLRGHAGNGLDTDAIMALTRGET